MAITIRGGTHLDGLSASTGGAYDYTVNPYGTYGLYKPGAATTGLPGGLSQSSLAVISGSAGDFTITDAVAAAANYRWDSVWFQCRVVVKTASVLTFTRCWFDGKAATAYGAIGSIDLNQNPGTNYNVRAYDSVLTAATPSIWNNGVVGHDVILERCNVFGVTDGVQLGSTLSGGANSHGTFRGCWVHDLTYFSPDTTNGTSERSNTHNDPIQWMGGNGLTTKGNFFDGRMNASVGAAQFDQAHRNPVIGGGPNNPFAVSSDAFGYLPTYPNLATNTAFQFNAGTAALSGWSSDSDWFGGGGYSINVSASVGGSCTNARFARTYLYGPIAAPSPNVSATVTTDFTGCVYEDTGAPVTIFRGP